MSFILDALRKSEHDRDRRALPGAVDVPVSRARQTRLPWLLGGIGALLLLNLGVLLYLLGRSAPAPHTAEPTTAVAATRVTAPATPMSTPHPATRAINVDGRTVRPLAAEVGSAEPLPDVPAPPRTASTDWGAAPASSPPTSYDSGMPRNAGTAGVPSIRELPPQATAGLPVLNIDLHVYSTEPAQRFAVINGQRVHDGSRLREGPLVERITPDGAVLVHNGARFLLPRD